jgi:SAM-dependent methyltransferase
VDLTPEFCAAARRLTAMTGLSERVDVVEADASRLPFTGGAFDVVWMQNSSMNIPDKARLFGEVRRVLRSGGLLALQEVVLGPAGLPVRFTVPWADVAPLSFLRAPGTLRQTLCWMLVWPCRPGPISPTGRWRSRRRRSVRRWAWTFIFGTPRRSGPIPGAICRRGDLHCCG